ncbi:hypothetical protein A8B73_05675 [Methylosinus sp. 3S-1]|nr:hypothetical protein A8B73_05675 [Methylosinus sp. 3S-1]
MAIGNALFTSRFSKFVLTSGIAAIVNIASRWVINHYTSFELAIVLSFCFGVSTAYFLGRQFVFERSRRNMIEEFARFITVNLLALVFAFAISVGFAKRIFPLIGFNWHVEDLSHLIGVAAPAVTSYFGHRIYTFRPSSATSGQAG